MFPIFRTEAFAADVDHQIHWYLAETDLDEVSRFPAAGRPRAVRFSDLSGYRGLNVFEPFGRFRIYYRVIGEELHAERLLEGHRLAASDDR